MLTLQGAITNDHDDHAHHHDDDDADGDEHIRDIHALTPPRPPLVNRSRWETGSHRSSSLSVSSETASSENFTTMSREFSALVIAGSSIQNNDSDSINTLNNHNQLTRIGEEEIPEETNPLAIVPDTNPFDQGTDQQPRVGSGASAASASASTGGSHMEVSVMRVKKEEVESKISAWQNAKVTKVNNRFKREDAIINGWESEQVQKATSWMKKVESFLTLIHAEEVGGEKSKSLREDAK